MQQLNLKHGAVRAGVTFVLTFAILKLFTWLLLGSVEINVFAENLLVFIAAGWAAYYVYRKTEVGYY